MSGSSRSYKSGLYRRLQNDAEARNYLQAAIDDSRSAFLVALRNVAEARNISKIARESSLHRVNMYRMLSETGNPTLGSLEKILHALGLRIAINVEDTNLREESASANHWHMVWHVASGLKKASSYYAGTTYGPGLRSSHSPEPGTSNCEHTFAAAAEDPYFELEHPVYMREQEDICEMAY